MVKVFLKEVYPWCPFSRLLADAYFSADMVLQLLKQRHLKYILNMRHYTPLKEVKTTIQETQYLLAKSNGLDASNDRFVYRWLKKRKFLTFRTAIKHENDSLVLIPLVIQTVLLKRKDKQGKKHFKLDHYVYMTNSTTSGQHILKTYKHRWGIKSGYRVVQKYQGRTTSKNVVFRVLLKGLEFVLTAIWIRLNVEMRRLGFTRSGISRLLRFAIPYQSIFTVNESFLDSPLPVLEVHKDNFLLLTTDQLSRIGQSLWR